MFPQLNVEPIMEDLRMTGSVPATIENILEGRVGFVPIPDEVIYSSFIKLSFFVRMMKKHQKQHI